MFLEDLHKKTVALMFINDSRTLEKAINVIRKVEASNYYKNRKNEDKPTFKLLNDLTQRMHQMAINYEKLTTTLAAKDEKLRKRVAQEQDPGTHQAQLTPMKIVSQEQTQAPVQPQLINTEELNSVDNQTSKRSTVAKCYIRIYNNPILVILDSRVAVSIISKILAAKLGLKITKLFNMVITVANTIESVIIPTNFQVLENLEEVMLLEMDWFQKAKEDYSEDPQETYSNDEGTNENIETYLSPKDIIEKLVPTKMLNNKQKEKAIPLLNKFDKLFTTRLDQLAADMENISKVNSKEAEVFQAIAEEYLSEESEEESDWKSWTTEYLIDFPKLTDDELEFKDSEHKIYDSGYAHNFQLGH
ncbi:582_t:CDS:2, partial [Cetraspora pellucida]